ncbi:hypothetical protein AZE42_11071 [Rhizopogon vesiculosus]|uniref:HTH CENPB-type domain-containing protein n=1 Tax=Rhizopogon vesiculosus TaxID=180088 RepID=A0A1J8R925_9AGAM|nr:hypothetical protein AZE42_11071 [Rhizopogon vesiculosus]
MLLGNMALDAHYSAKRRKPARDGLCLPGKQWIHRFVSHHSDILMAKLRRFDPKRAQDFNRATITEYFDTCVVLNQKYDGIPPEHNWNVDEKGCQMGGGRNGIKIAVVSTVISKYFNSQQSIPPTNAVVLANSGISALAIFKPLVKL